MVSTEAVTTAGSLIELATTVYDEHYGKAPAYCGLNPPDGFWKYFLKSNVGTVNQLLIQKGGTTLDINRFPANSGREITVWYVNFEEQTQLRLERFPGGTLRAYMPDDIPIEAVPQELLESIAQFLSEA